VKTRIIGIIIALLAFAACSRQPAPVATEISVPLVRGALPAEAPDSGLWNQAPEFTATLLKQDITEPMLTEPGVDRVRVRALHNGEWVAFRLEWNDPSQDLIPLPGHSSDAAAIQFPFQAGEQLPDHAMGEKGKGVRIWFWKSVWQDDAARAQGKQGDRIAALYPNAAVDHYPFQANEAARAEMEKRYAPARAAENPITVRPTENPVQVLMAEGYGNTRVAPAQTGKGRGEWTGGKWSVTLARPLAGGADLGDLVAGKRSYLALAVWDGAKSQAGSRKMRSTWIPFMLNPR
jgi:DMSO reductase family type II enzyme heme b subunit